MSEPLNIERAGNRWRLRGQLDERAHLPDLADQVPQDTRLHLDLEAITYINSLGVRDWSTFLRKLGDRGVHIQLERCAEVMVHQMSMIVDARGVAEVDSFMAPYLCDACGWEGHLVLEVAEVAPQIMSGRTPPGICAECGADARFADFVDRYFLFLEPPP